jgi:hypothetical protein
MSEGRGRGLRTLFPIVLILVLAGLGGAAAAVLLLNSAHIDAMNGLEPASDHLDFGEVWEDTQFSMVLPITNHRGQDIEIKQFIKSCNCSRVEPPSLTIPARQTREIRLILDLTAKKPEEFAADSRDFEVNISPEIPDERRSTWWTIRGRVRSVLQSNLPRIDFWKVSELSQSSHVKKATLKARNRIQNLAVTCSCPNVEVQVEKPSTTNANQFDVLVALKKPKKRGAIRCSIMIVPELSDGSQLPPRQLEVLGDIVSDIEASPSNIFFAGCPVGTSKSQTVSLRSLTDQPFEVKGTRCEGDGLSVEHQGRASKGGLALGVVQKIEWRGEQNGKVFFRIARPGGSEEEVVVHVSYSGL